MEVYYFFNGKLHRKDGPAYEDFYGDGSLKSSTWYKAGKHHRLYGPSSITMYPGGEGKIRREEWHRDGYPFRADGGPYFREWSSDGTLKWSNGISQGLCRHDKIDSLLITWKTT